MVEHDNDADSRRTEISEPSLGAGHLAPVKGSWGRRAVRRTIRAAPPWVRTQAIRRCRAAIVTGTGRCGTTYVTELLRALGVRAGHEAIFRTGGYCYMPDAQVDSSWLAVPHLDAITSPTVHLVRDPLDVISSLVGIRFFAKRRSAYTQYAYTHCEGLTGEDELVDALRWYVRWNERIEHHVESARRFRVEDLGDVDAVERLLDALALSASGDGVAAALARTSTTSNTRPRTEVTWDDLRAHCDEADVADLASINGRYGYGRR